MKVCGIHRNCIVVYAADDCPLCKSQETIKTMWEELEKSMALLKEIKKSGEELMRADGRERKNRLRTGMLMTWRPLVVAVLMITVFILMLSIFTDDKSERSRITRRPLPDQGVEASAGKAPLSFSEVLNRISSEYGIPPKLVIAIIQVESQGNPKAISPAGALGLMQLMPEVIKACGVEDPFDPVANLLAGVRHLNYLLLEFSGNLTMALSAYNAGSARVRQYGGIPPFPETWKFVNSVLRRYQGVGNELETFLRALEVPMRSIQIYKEDYLVRGSKELLALRDQEPDRVETRK